MKLKISGIFTSLLVVALLLTACDSAPTSLYKTYSVKRGGRAFSLEYPTSYRLTAIDTFGSRDAKMGFKVQFARTKPVRGLTHNFFEIGIGGPTVNQVLSGSVSGVTDPVVLERYSTTISGLPAEVLVFSSAGFFAPRTITRAAFLELDEAWTWTIDPRSEEAGAGLGKAEFEHIVETFKVLP